MGKLFKYLIIFGALYYGARFFIAPEMAEANIAEQLAPGNQVVMYSLTTCGYCTEKRGRLQDAGIPFTEHFVDSDAARMDEFNALLTANSIAGGGVGTPTFTVNGTLLVNNPDMATIKKHLKLKG